MKFKKILLYIAFSLFFAKVNAQSGDGKIFKENLLRIMKIEDFKVDTIDTEDTKKVLFYTSNSVLEKIVVNEIGDTLQNRFIFYLMDEKLSQLTKIGFVKEGGNFNFDSKKTQHFTFENEKMFMYSDINGCGAPYEDRYIPIGEEILTQFDIYLELYNNKNNTPE